MAAKYYFYCPSCGRQDSANRLPEGTNQLSAEVHPIYYYVCPKCQCQQSGYMKYDVENLKGLKHSKQCKQFRNKIKELYNEHSIS